MTDQPGIPPASIIEIREARGESQNEFANQLGVSNTAVSRWERGKMPPSPENIDAIRECIPEDLDVDDVVDNPELSRDWDGQLSSAAYRLFGSEELLTLREEPRTADELPSDGGIKQFAPEQRQFVHQLKVGTQLGQTEKAGGRAATVYYLEGDERRAIRRFIEANEEIVADALAKQANRFQHEWSDFLYGLLEEEWRFWLCR